MKARTWPALATAAMVMPLSAMAQDAYVIGLTGAMTGPPASTYAPAVDALRIYIDRVNAGGGINGKKVSLILQDDSAQPGKAAANAKQLITQDNVILMLNASLSSTYAPVAAEAKQANVPLLFPSSVCPQSVYPPADPLQFCTTAFAANYDSRATLAFIKETAKQPAPAHGMTVVGKEVIPPPTPDYTPFATKLKDAGANWVFSWAPWVTQVRTFEALRRLDWKGDYIAWAHLEAEGELKRIKDGKLYVIGANALFDDKLPIQQEIADAAKAANSKYPPEQMAEGWIAGMVIEAALKGAAAPASAARVQASVQNLSVDLKGLRGGPIQWTKDNHFRTRQFYRVYRWDGSKIAVVKDWFAYDVK